MIGAHQNVWNAVYETARRLPDGIAIVHEGQGVTFADCLKRAGAYAAQLKAIGGGRPQRVIIWMNNSPEMAAALLGAWGAGWIPVILHATSPAAHVVHAVETTGAKALVQGPDQSCSRGLDRRGA